MDPSDIKQTEERHYFRVNKHIELSYCIYEDHQKTVDDSNLFDDKTGKHFKLMQELHKSTEESQKFLSTISMENPEIADYLNIMNDKIHYLANYMFDTGSRACKMVDISVGGLGFWNETEIPIGSKLRLKVVLPPTYYGFLTNAEVVQCRYLPKKDADCPHKISLKFINLPADIQQMLNEDIFQTQRRQLAENAELKS